MTESWSLADANEVQGATVLTALERAIVKLIAEANIN
jgi:hypothetical protein